MIGAIIIGHGNFGSSILASAEMIIGEQENVQTIDFLNGDSLYDIDRKINQVLDELDTKDGVIILADLTGGTPFNRSIMMASENPNIKVIGGINLSLVLEILNSRSDNDDFEKTIEESIEMSKEMIVFGNKLLNDV